MTLNRFFAFLACICTVVLIVSPASAENWKYDKKFSRKGAPGIGFTSAGLFYLSDRKIWNLSLLIRGKQTPKRTRIKVQYSAKKYNTYEIDLKNISARHLKHTSGNGTSTNLVLTISKGMVDRLDRARSFHLLVDDRKLGNQNFTIHLNNFSPALKKLRTALASNTKPKSQIQVALEATKTCNRLATHPWDNRTDDPGISWNELDGKAAVKHCLKAADLRSSGNGRLTYQLGRAYDKAGDGKSAMVMISAAARKEYPIAYLHLGILHKMGIYTKVDKNKARRNFRRAADLGSVPGKFEYAKLEFLQPTSAVNKRAAEKMLFDASNAGYAESTEFLGIQMSKGKISGKSASLAPGFLRKASRQGRKNASYRLAVMYKNGIGVSRSNSEYRKFMALAARQGHKKAKELGF